MNKIYTLLALVIFTATTSVSYAQHNAVLPLTLTHYEGYVENGKAMLTWTIAENELAVKFVIERSDDGKNFSIVKTIYPTKKEGIESYSYKETSHLKGNVFYRLQLISSDSYFEYSKMLLIKNQNFESNSNIILNQNPVVNKLAFNYQSSSNTTSNITIYNAFGMIVYAGKAATSKEANTIGIYLDNNFKKGSYILEVTNEYDRTTTKFLKQ